MIIIQPVRSLFFVLMRYLIVFIPITLVLLIPIYYWGNLLGSGLINLFGEVQGLFLRPLVISLLYIFIFTALLSSRVEKLNQYLWFNKFSTQEVKRIYKTYIYSITSVFVVTLLVVCLTLFFGSDFWINWFNSRHYLSYYFLIVLVLSPFIAIFPRRAS
jgi:hypothetical protein